MSLRDPNPLQFAVVREDACVEIEVVKRANASRCVAGSVGGLHLAFAFMRFARGAFGCGCSTIPITLRPICSFSAEQAPEIAKL
ncbi:MAG: hypothetical protein GY822_19515 [Deltaproteobacteria bacterium]|nr:hypothetical protein [Deltaproteobacteria bacterium]